MSKHTHIFETSLVVYVVKTDSDTMDWEKFFLEILPEKNGKVVTIEKDWDGEHGGQRGDRQYSTS